MVNLVFQKMMSLFTNQDASEHGIYCYEFDESDIKRSPLVRYIVETISQKKIKVYYRTLFFSIIML